MTEFVIFDSETGCVDGFYSEHSDAEQMAVFYRELLGREFFIFTTIATHCYSFSSKLRIAEQDYFKDACNSSRD